MFLFFIDRLRKNDSLRIGFMNKILFSSVNVSILFSSVVDPVPHGSGTFAWIRIRNSENSKLDPDPE